MDLISRRADPGAGSGAREDSEDSAVGSRRKPLEAEAGADSVLTAADIRSVVDISGADTRSVADISAVGTLLVAGIRMVADIRAVTVVDIGGRSL